MRPTPMETEARLSKTQESKRDNKQPIGKQHAHNQSEEGKSLRGGESEKEEETGKKNRVKEAFFLNINKILYK